MLHIRPVSDLRNKYPEVEKIAESGEPVFLTKNGYGSMVLMSLEQYARLTEGSRDKESSCDTGVVSPEASTDSQTKSGLFKSRKKTAAEPVNPELQRESEEKNLGKHSMLDHSVLPLPPSSSSLRI